MFSSDETGIQRCFKPFHDGYGSTFRLTFNTTTVHRRPPSPPPSLSHAEHSHGGVCVFPARHDRRRLPHHRASVLLSAPLATTSRAHSSNTTLRVFQSSRPTPPCKCSRLAGDTGLRVFSLSRPTPPCKCSRCHVRHHPASVLGGPIENVLPTHHPASVLAVASDTTLRVFSFAPLAPRRVHSPDTTLQVFSMPQCTAVLPPQSAVRPTHHRASVLVTPPCGCSRHTTVRVFSTPFGRPRRPLVGGEGRG